MAEAALDSLTEVLVVLHQKNAMVTMALRLCCGEDLRALAVDGLRVQEEDQGEWLVTFALPEGGEAP